MPAAVSAAPSPYFIPSRTTGVAPLAVFFDTASSTASTTDTAVTSRPFHELEYRWDFGDPTAGTWNYGAASTSKNAAYGPLAAHVFESVGTYTVRVTVTNGTDTVSTTSQITVTDPNTQFSGTATLCVDNGATPVAGSDGCPSGAAVLNSSDFDAVINTTAGNGASHQRILFRKGKTYTASTAGVISADGPGLVGSYGASGAKPVIAGTGGKLSLGSTTNHDFGDWRIMDLEFSGSGGVGDAISHAGTSARVTIMRNTIDDPAHGVIFAVGTLDTINNPTKVQELYSELAMIENVLTNANNYNIFGGASKLMVLGNQLSGAGDHGMRTQYTSNSVVSNNEFGGGNAQTSLTMRGTLYATSSRTGQAGEFTLPDAIYTELGVMSENRVIGAAGQIAFTLKSVNSTEDARFRNHIIENNWMSLGTSGLQIFQTESGELTIRNNVFDTTNAAGAQIAIFFTKSSGTPAPADSVRVYNNTHFTNKTDATNPVFTVDIASGNAMTNVFIRNNLGYAPNNTNANTATTRNVGGATITESYNSTGTQIKATSPSFANASGSFSSPNDFKLNVGSYALGTTTSQLLGVFTDFARTARQTAPSIGAWDINAPTVTTQAASSITSTGAAGNGTITVTGGANSTARGVVYGLTTSYGATSTESGSFSTGAFTRALSGLSCNTLYHLNPFATNSIGTSYGSDSTFTTSACVPTVTTGSASSITSTAVTLEGNITATGGANATARGIVYGLTTAYTATSTASGSFSTGAFTQGISDLVCNTVYHFSSYATNSTGTSYGTDSTFTTSACAASTVAGGGPPGLWGQTGGDLNANRSLFDKPVVTASSSQGATTEAKAPTAIPSFRRNLSLHAIGNDVVELQRFLNQSGYPIAKTGAGSNGRETRYFGPATYRALIRFQVHHGLPASGYLGPRTRKVIEGLGP